MLQHQIQHEANIGSAKYVFDWSNFMREKCQTWLENNLCEIGRIDENGEAVVVESTRASISTGNTIEVSGVKVTGFLGGSNAAVVNASWWRFQIEEPQHLNGLYKSTFCREPTLFQMVGMGFTNIQSSYSSYHLHRFIASSRASCLKSRISLRLATVFHGGLLSGLATHVDHNKSGWTWSIPRHGCHGCFH
jgi:hypothetical protein